MPAPRPIRAAAEAIPLDIVYEDADLIVIDKPAGLVVHPAPGAPDGTLVNALLHHCGGIAVRDRRAAPAGHRAPDRQGHLRAAGGRQVRRRAPRAGAAVRRARPRAALPRGDPRRARIRPSRGSRISPAITWEPGGVLRIEGRIGRHPGDRKRMAVLSEIGKPAVTRARVLERFGPAEAPAAALVECRLETGRTHQIRVHMAFAGHPLVGDAVYGRRRGDGAARRLPAAGAARGEPRLRPSGDRRGAALRGAAAGRHRRRCSRRCDGCNEAQRFSTKCKASYNRW